ncbi:PAP2 superfamily-domain-containing protein [Lipomyces arxii]|uniref:PAP2 superfamily-domain-containing protein n=1 Tax=Lipomyces arxii TaxID=56418 RepID=UPI0034CE4737
MSKSAVKSTSQVEAKVALADNVDGYTTVNFKDAGNRTRDHYKSNMTKTRFKLRQYLLPLIRWETARLAWIQEHCRTPFWDEYFALSANLGAHTFFVIMLPMPFWFGLTHLGRDLVYVLASGVLFSGMMKDYFCLPRPLSPPLHRISMSGSAALEYGFISTHSTNAVGAALTILSYSLEHGTSLSFVAQTVIKTLTWVYMLSIVFGRIYCGMHGFLDVIAGSLLGYILFYIRHVTESYIDEFVRTPGPLVPLIVAPVILILVRIHPEPVDPCPCFEDGVAFAGVVLGVDLGLWSTWKLPHTDKFPYPGASHYVYAESGLVGSILRMVLGIASIFTWRAIMKPMLHTYLPPVFRVIEKVGLSMPRGFFLKASEYSKVPDSIPDSTLVDAGGIKTLLSNMRMRSDSVGPQSPADVYESMANYEERQRRRSLEQNLYPQIADQLAEEDKVYFEIPKPRVQYDVEVVTKLIVYTGIGWLGASGCSLLFAKLGL